MESVTVTVIIITIIIVIVIIMIIVKAIVAISGDWQGRRIRRWR